MYIQRYKTSEITDQYSVDRYVVVTQGMQVIGFEMIKNKKYTKIRKLCKVTTSLCIPVFLMSSLHAGSLTDKTQ